jgi:predicted SprT family Zn-dependent metalloprotease
MRTPVTTAEYSSFQQAFEYFNRRLFENALPDAMITLQRVTKAKGYFWADQFRHRTAAGRTIDEIALNPDTFDGRTDEDILSTLVHEMTHFWQKVHGKPGRRGYHNQQWADKMKSIGLQPTSTGGPGGKETGEHMTHLIVAGGVYAVAVAELLARGFALSWNATPAAPGDRKKKKNTRSKFTCPECGANAWAKPGMNLWCGDCTEAADEAVIMLEEAADEEQEAEAA